MRLSVDPDIFDQNFDQRAMYVQHALADHPLLQLESIAALSDRLPPDHCEWNTEQPEAFTAPNTLKPHLRSCNETIRRVGEEPARILLLNIQDDPKYKRLMDELLDGIQLRSERLRPGMWGRQAFLFISARDAFTPFHFDPDYNFLLQVTGKKTVYMWDPANRFVLPASRIDNYYAGLDRNPTYSNRDQRYRDEFMTSAWKLTMEPGQGLHFPLHAPHAIRTDSDIAISLSVTFHTRRSQFNAMVHGANGHVRRKLGIEPPEPGASRLWDIAANIGYRGIRKFAGRFKR
jgi:Cupin-like domain